MEYVIIWIVLSIIAAIIARNKARSAIGFFLLAFFLSPIVGIVAALVAGPDRKKLEEKQIASGEYKRCPYCAEVIRKEAIICPHCRHDQPS